MILVVIIFCWFHICLTKAEVNSFTNSLSSDNYITKQNADKETTFPFQGCHEQVPPPSSLLIPDSSSAISTGVAVYYIDLDLPPEERWQYLASDKKSQIQKLIDVLRANAENIFGNKVFDLIDNYMPYLTRTLPKEYYDELVGVSIATELTVGEITLYNIFYEFYSVCTSIVMQDSEGHMHHGRNLDFGFLLGWDISNKTWLAAELLRPLIVKVEFQRNRQTIYSSINFAGYIGILTAVKKNKFSLSVNERFKLNGGFVGIIEWIFGRRNQKWLGILTRDVMENADDFKDAQKMLSLPKLVAPCYFIIAGNKSNQGSVITRGRGESEIWNVGVDENQPDGSWYLVQTNYDHWKKQPVYDDRRTPAVTCMDKFGRKSPLYTLYNVLSTVPVLNKLTVYTAIMDVVTGTLDLWLQDCVDPCWPW